MAHRAGAYPGFRRNASPLQGVPPPPSLKFTGTHLYTWAERGTVRVKCLAQEHNVPGKGSNPDRSIRVQRADHEASCLPQLVQKING